MNKPKITIHNAQTGEITTREMSEDELDQYKKDQDDNEIRLNQKQAKAAQRQAIADRLGLTLDELKLLFG